MSRLLVVGVMSLFAFLHVPSMSEAALGDSPVNVVGIVVDAAAAPSAGGWTTWCQAVIRDYYENTYVWVNFWRIRLGPPNEELVPITSDDATRALNILSALVTAEDGEETLARPRTMVMLNMLKPYFPGSSTMFFHAGSLISAYRPGW